MRCTDVQVDAVVFGGGVAGLWTLQRLQKAGVSALLFESDALGAGQTVRSQGIIHGGLKYTLSGAFTDASRAVSAMPARWRGCLAGDGEIDLSATHVLSEHQYLFSTTGVASRLATFLAGQSVRAHAAAVPPEERPEAFRNPRFRGSLYRLDEPVLDVPTLMSSLASGVADRLLSYRAESLEVASDTEGATVSVAADDRNLRLRARWIVLTAGAGNERLASLSGVRAAMQRRPLHMVLVRHASLPAVYAHAVTAGTTPRFTITTHRDSTGTPVWYVGGRVAESGVERTPIEQIRHARRELSDVLPWIDLSEAEFTTVRVDRAEAAQPGGQRPDGVTLVGDGPVLLAWPTKLALAPRLADLILERLEPGPEGADDRFDPGALVGWPRPSVAPAPWQESQTWIDARSAAPA